MTVSKHSFLIFFKNNWPFFAALSLVILFFYKFFLFNQIPIPGDFVIGTYFPWLDYKWGYTVGVPVKNPITTDVVSFTYPMRILAVEGLKKGIVPLWNPYILTGIPLLANFQSAPFSLTIPLYFFFDTLTAWGLQVAVQHFLAILFTYVLLRHWNLSKRSSLFGGLIYAFSGYNLIWSQWNAHTLAASFVPLIIYFLDKFFRSRNLNYLIGLSFSLFFQIVSGYPQGTLYTLLTLFVVWLFTVWSEKNKIKFTLLPALFIIFGVGLAGLQILPAAELLGQSQRGVEPLEFSWAFLPYEKIITFVAPDYFGNHSTKNYWGPQDYTSNTGYVGVVALLFSLYALKAIRMKHEVRLLSTLCIVSLLFAFPTPFSLFFWNNGILGLQAASAHRALIIFTLSVAGLAAFGLDELFTLKSKGGLKDVSYFFIPIGIVLGGYGLYAVHNYLFPDFPNDKIKYLISLRNLVIPVFVFLLLLILILLRNRFKRVVNFYYICFLMVLLFELFRFGWKFTPFTKRDLVFPTTPVIDYLKKDMNLYRTTGSDVIPINLRMPYSIPTVEGYDAIYPVSIAKLIAFMNSENLMAVPQGRYATVSNRSSAILDLLNTKYFIALKKDAKGNPSLTGTLDEIYLNKRFNVIFEDKTTVILENKNALPRAFMVYDWEEEIDSEKTLLKLLRLDFNQKALVSESIESKSEKDIKSKFSIVNEQYEEDKNTYRVSTSTSGLFITSDLYYPGWNAFIDGKESHIYKVNFAFRGVLLPAGTHVVTFKYIPTSFRNGMLLSLGSLIVLVSIGIADKIKHQRIKKDD